MGASNIPRPSAIPKKTVISRKRTIAEAEGSSSDEVSRLTRPKVLFFISVGCFISSWVRLKLMSGNLFTKGEMRKRGNRDERSGTDSTGPWLCAPAGVVMIDQIKWNRYICMAGRVNGQAYAATTRNRAGSSPGYWLITWSCGGTGPGLIAQHSLARQPFLAV